MDQKHIFRCPSQPSSIYYISYFLKIVENQDISATHWNDSETPKYVTFFESAHYMGAGDTHIVEKFFKNIFGLQGSTLRMFKPKKASWGAYTIFFQQNP